MSSPSAVQKLKLNNLHNSFLKTAVAAVKTSLSDVCLMLLMFHFLLLLFHHWRPLNYTLPSLLQLLLTGQEAPAAACSVARLHRRENN